MSVKCQKRNMLQFDMINRKLKKTEGAINSGQSRDTGNSGHMTCNQIICLLKMKLCVSQILQIVCT